MDHFGIGQAIEGAAHCYIQNARRTGKTTHLIQNLKDGDRVVFADQKEAKRVKQLCLERNIHIDTVVVSHEHPENIFQHKPSEGRTIFDHFWLEQFYLGRLRSNQLYIDHLQTEASGYGEAHLETLKKARAWHREDWSYEEE